MSSASGQGPDRPTLAFAHANGVPGGSYRHFLAPLESRYQLAVVDRIGHDPAFPVDAHWHSLSLEMESFLAPLPKPLVGMGHSMGGVLMFMVACRRPEWFSSLVMLDPPLINGWFRPLFNLLRRLGQTDRLTPAGKSLGRRDHWADQDQVQEYFSTRALYRRFDPRCLEDFIEAATTPCEGGFCLRFDPAVEVAIFRQTPGNLNRFPRLPVPGAVITGAQSEPVFHQSHRRHVRRHRMIWAQAPGGHMFPLEQPDKAVKVVETVLDQLAAIKGGQRHAA